MNRVRLEGSVHVALTPAQAFQLFTPSGERRWAAGWEPRFPVAAADETEPGTVFTTEHDSRSTTWMVVGRDADLAITYCNVSEAGRAALIQVSCEPGPDGMTTATVTYDVTALDPAGAAWLDEFAAGYPQYMQHWERAIAAALSA